MVDPYTIYANAYYVEQPYSTVSAISKHYYMGMQRIATNLGSGEVIEEPGGEPGMEKTNQTGNNAVVNNLIEVLANFGAKEGTDYTREQLTQTPNFTDYYPQDSSMQTQANKATPPQGTASALALDPPSGPTVPSARLLYYYHPDYLGNVEYITDASGLPYQYFFYSPWGEPLADQKASTANWESPYKFNGKEQDEETGLYYYGARYYNPQVSVWLSVDPLAAKSPNQTPYHFVSNNPIMRIDPDGLTDYLNAETGECYYVDDGINANVTVSAENWQMVLNQTSFEVVVTASSSDYGTIFKNEQSVKVANYLRNTPFFGPINKPVPNPFFRADAIAIDGGAIFLGQEYDAGLYLVLNGEDVGSVIPFKENANGGGGAAALGIEVGRVDYFGSETFNTSMLFGPRDKWQVDVLPFGEGFAIGAGLSTSRVNENGTIYTTNVQLSFGASPEPFIFFAWNRGAVKPW